MNDIDYVLDSEIFYMFSNEIYQKVYYNSKYGLTKFERWHNNGIPNCKFFTIKSRKSGEYKEWNSDGTIIHHEYWGDKRMIKLTINIKCTILKLKKKLLRKIRLKKYGPSISEVVIKDLIPLCISYI
jgi:hypothetical protein